MSSSVSSSLRSLLRSQLARGAVATLVIQVAGAGVGYGMQVVLARWLGSAAYGTYVYALDWGLLLATVGSLGLPVAVLRFIPQYRSSQSHSLLRGLLRSSRRLVLCGTTGLSLVGSVLLFVLQPSHLNLSALLLGLWLAPIFGLMLLETEILRAAQRMVLAYGPSRVLRRMLLLGGVGVLAALAVPPSPIAVLGLAAFASLAIFLIQRWGTASTFREELAGIPSRQKIKFWLRISFPLLLSKGFLMIISKTDIFVIGALTSSEHVGVYNAALQTAHTVTFIGFAIDAVAAPAVSSRYKEGKAALQQLSSQLAHWYFWPTLGMSVILIPLSTFILGVFGPDFVDARPEMIILLMGLMVNAGTGAQTYLLQLTGHERLCARVYGWVAVLNVLLNCTGVFLLGTLGAALSTALSMVIWNVWLHQLVTIHVGVYPSIITACTRALRKPAS